MAVNKPVSVAQKELFLITVAPTSPPQRFSLPRLAQVTSCEAVLTYFYTESLSFKSKVLDFIKSGGPSWIRTRDLGLIRTAL